MLQDRQNGLSKGYGFISFNNDKAMQSALTYSSHLLAGREVKFLTNYIGSIQF